MTTAPAPSPSHPAGQSSTTPPRLTTLAVVGTGLIGTSIALAARAAGTHVLLADRDEDALAAAIARGAGEQVADGAPPVDLAVLAVPPHAVAATLRHAQDTGLARAYTDVASTKASVVTRTQAHGCRPQGFLPGHPVAGSERSGPGAADAELFRGAAWVLCPQAETGDFALRVVRDLVELCGGRPVEMAADAHDRAMALVSHGPHVVAAALAAAIGAAPTDVLRLAGRGVRDTTRIAAGDPALWTDIVEQNAEHVAVLLADIAADLGSAATALSAVARGDREALAVATDLLTRGTAGRRNLMAAGADPAGAAVPG
ncbi:prephenate dehydrogenase [Actinosynnema sp. NPDC050801]|uniref:prephenate dehydrogenase n=1 Tax=unclassified Actinosynnema TaxID=2637065 RepID=UPI0033EAB599